MLHPQIGALVRRFADVRVAGAPTQSLQLALACVVDKWPDSFARYLRGVCGYFGMEGGGEPCT